MVNSNFWIAAFIVIFNLIVLSFSIYNYQTTKISEFKLFIYIFVFGLLFGIYPLIQILLGENYILPNEINYFEETDSNFFIRLIYFIYMTSPMITIFFVVIYFSRSIWLRPPKVVIYSVSFGVSLSILMNIPVLLNSFLFFGYGPYQAMLIRSWISLIPFLIDGALAVKLITELKNPVINTPRIRKAARFWKFAFLFTAFTSVAKLVRDITALFKENWTPELNSQMTTITAVFVSLSFLFVALIVIIYPEGVLIFQVHIIRAKKLYKYLPQDIPKSTLNMSHLESYIQQIIELKLSQVSNIEKGPFSS